MHPGAPPDIRTNSAYRRQQEFGEKKSSRGSSLQVGSSTDKVVHSESTSKAQVRYNSAPSSSDINYEINYGQEDSSELEDLPHQDFQYHREGYQPEKYSGNSEDLFPSLKSPSTYMDRMEKFQWSKVIKKMRASARICVPIRG